MGIRILRIELRRSVALWAALLITAVGVFLLFTSNPPYRTWLELVIVQRDIMQLTWPLALAAGAWQALRERRSGVEELLATTPRPRWRRVVPAASATAIAAVTAHLVMLAAGTGHLRDFVAYFPPGAVPVIALGALGLLAAAWLGMAIGGLLPSPLTPPALAVAGFAILALLPSVLFDSGNRPGAMLFWPHLQGPRDGGFDFQTLSAGANLSQAVWLAAVAASGLALYAAARHRSRAAAVLPLVLGAAIAAQLMPGRIAAAWVEDRRANEVVCTRGEPALCILRARSHVLDGLRGPARRAVAALAAKLPPAPRRVLVTDPDAPAGAGWRRADTLPIMLPRSGDPADYDRDELLWIMLDGAGVPPCLTPTRKSVSSGDRHRAARMAAAAWLLDRDLAQDKRPESAPVRRALAVLRALPAAEQRARVTALRDAERTCAAGDRMEILTGERGPR